MIKTIPIGAIALALIASAAWAQEENISAQDGNSWRDGVIARCAQQYSAEQCQNSEFLEENFHISSLETAHRTAMQRTQDERKALRELTLQYVCSRSISDNCAADNNAAQCAAQLQEACTTLKAEASLCVKNAEPACANDIDASACYKQRVALCPSLKKQPVEQLLAKHPRLTATQRSRLLATASELEAKNRGWWSNLIAWLQSPL